MRIFFAFWGTYVLYLFTLVFVIAIFEFGLVENFLISGDSAVHKVVAEVSGKKVEQSSEQLPYELTDELIADLQKGGFTLFIRHTTRDSFGNSDAVLDRSALLDIAEEGQVESFQSGICLTDVGRAEAVILGHAFTVLNIPVGTVYSSPICRAVETAELAFGRVDVITTGLAWDALLKEDEKERRTSLGHEVMEKRPAEGKNKVIAAHAPTLKSLGYDYSSLAVGAVLVLAHSEEDELEPVALIHLDAFSKAIPLKDFGS